MADYVDILPMEEEQEAMETATADGTTDLYEGIEDWGEVDEADIQACDETKNNVLSYLPEWQEYFAVPEPPTLSTDPKAHYDVDMKTPLRSLFWPLGDDNDDVYHDVYTVHLPALCGATILYDPDNKLVTERVKILRELFVKKITRRGVVNLWLNTFPKKRQAKVMGRDTDSEGYKLYYHRTAKDLNKLMKGNLKRLERLKKKFNSGFFNLDEAKEAGQEAKDTQVELEDKMDSYKSSLLKLSPNEQNFIQHIAEGERAYAAWYNEYLQI